MSKIRATLLKRGLNGKLDIQVLEDFDETLENIYRVVECETIDIITRKIKGRIMAIILDDEYLLSDLPLSAPTGVFIPNPRREQLFGNLLITGLTDDDGNLTSLNEDDIKAIFYSIYHTGTTKNNDYFETLGYDFF